jgi:hypothetical protein
VIDTIEERINMRRIVYCVFAILLLTTAAEASGGDEIWYSVFFPGWGQVRAGRYGRGSLMAAAEIVTLTSLVMVNIQYDRTVEQYERARVFYLTSGYIGDIEHYYDEMKRKWDDADRLHTYRNVLAGAAVGIWAISLLDMVLFDDDDGPPLSLGIGRDGFTVAKTFSF